MARMWLGAGSAPEPDDGQNPTAQPASEAAASVPASDEPAPPEQAEPAEPAEPQPLWRQLFPRRS